MKNEKWLAFAAALLVTSILSLLCLAVYTLNNFTFGIGSSQPEFSYLNLQVPVIASVSFGLLVPIAIIALRHQVRIARIRLIDIFQQKFNLGRDKNEAFEFARSKYYVDLHDGEKSTVLPRFPFGTGSDWLLLVSALPMMGFAAAGSLVLMAPYDAFRDGGVLGAHVWPSLLAIGGLDLSKTAYTAQSIEKYYHREFLLIATMGFFGGYIYSLMLLLRAVANFDLNSITFLRTFVHMVLATVLSVVIWRASTQTVTHFFGETAVQATIKAADSKGVPLDPAGSVSFPLWLAISFAIGFIPDAGLQRILQLAKVNFKPRLSKFDARAPAVPLTVLDGVDVFVAFRLEQANLFDVQALATANPIMLHIETPYGIYTTFDWVAQAQLCTLVGPDRYFLLKRFHVRTIFDLERALIGPSVDSKFKQLIILALLAADDERAAIEKEIGVKGYPAGFDLFKGDATKLIGMSEAVSQWLDQAFVDHMAAVLLDDLHIRRLRQIWNHMVEKLGPESERLRDWSGQLGTSRAGRHDPFIESD